MRDLITYRRISDQVNEFVKKFGINPIAVVVDSETALWLNHESGYGAPGTSTGVVIHSVLFSVSAKPIPLLIAQFPDAAPPEGHPALLCFPTKSDTAWLSQ